MLVVAANAPDFDVISWFWGRPTWLHWHRNITHSLVGMPIMALLSVALVALVCRKKLNWWQAFLIALAGVASHLILDLTNVYGVRLLLPFSGHWTHWDIAPVVDFAIWGILLLGVAAPAFSRLVGSEIGEMIPNKGQAGWAVAALLLLTVYDLARINLHGQAVAEISAHTYGGSGSARYAPRRVGAFPTASPLAWRGMAEMSYGYVDVPVNLLTSFRPADAAKYYKPPRTLGAQAAMATYPFQMLLEFVQYPLWVIQPALDADGDTRVSLLDLRFGTPMESGFAATALVDKAGRVRDSVFGLGEVKAR